MRARFSSICPYCKKEILPGEEISKGVAGWGHSHCVPKPAKKGQRRCIECGKWGNWEYDSEAGGYVCPACQQLYM